MTEITADVTVPYRVFYRPYRARKERRDNALLFAKRKVSIAVSSAAEAPPAFLIKSANGTQDSENSYMIRSFDRKLWWPVPDRHNKPVNAARFLEGLASGAHEYIEVLNPTQLWYGGHQHTFEKYFANRPKHEILENHLEGDFTGIQRVAAQIMLCEDTVHFAGGAPAFFGHWPDHSTDRSISLSVGNLGGERGPRLLGLGRQLKDDALRDGYVFDLPHLTREVAMLKSRGMAVEVIHEIERVGDIAVKDEALLLSAHTAVMRLFGASSDISAAYRDLIPDRCRVDSSKLVPLQICREIFTDALQRRWPDNFGKRHISLALKSATYVLARLELNAELSLTPEDDEALASIM